MGASLFVSVLAGGSPTPITAVGSRVIDATPGAVKDWAIRTLGAYDKPFLLGGIYGAIALLAAATGVIAWRSRRVALVVTALLGVLGLAAAAADRSTLVSPVLKVLPAIVALAVSVTLLAWFTSGWNSRRTTTDAPASAELEPVAVGGSTAAGSGSATEGLTDALQPVARSKATEESAPAGFDRRAFLAAALVSGAVAATGYGTSQVFGRVGARSRDAIRLPRAADAAAAVPTGGSLNVPGLSSYITSNKDFYRVDTALSVPQIDASTWTLKIHGLVDREIELSFADLLDMPLVERRITLACVSNEVGGHYAGNASWLGVRTDDLLKELGIRDGADAVKSTSVDGMTIGTPLEALTDGRDAMIAIGMNGEPLPLAHGFPARLVVPGLYGYVSATKWVVDLEITRFADFSAYWTDRGFAAQAPIKLFSRIDVPRSFASLDKGRNAVAGVAWAQNTGISKVEVRVDAGNWVEARLAAQDSIDTWRQWVYEWDADSGTHNVEVRATDADGNTQTSRRVSPRPDGATGWHSVNVTVT